ncbi:NLRC3 [Symbiodinium sp. CCMP2456]|nr:NLRC3 [Symbiodinium sp. CCMP2456]
MVQKPVRQARSQNGPAAELPEEPVSQVAKSDVQGETAAGPEAPQKESLKNPKHLQNFLVEANIRLVRLEYLFKLAEAGRIWPRRQEGEAEEFEDSDGKIRTALVTIEEIRNRKLQLGDASKQGDRVILSVSHTWESQQHPDPWGWQLQSLLQHLQNKSTDAPLNLTREGVAFWREQFNVQFWVFIDFMCLPQYRRSEEEQEFFTRAMRSMHLLYAHEHICRVIRLEELTPESEKSTSGSIDIYCEKTGKFEPRPFAELVLNSTPYSMRGWCVAEVQWMSTKSVFFGFSPMTPAEFQERVARGGKGQADGLCLKFTHRSDVKLVTQLQEEVFLERAGQRTELIAWALPQQEIATLTNALPHFVNLEILRIDGGSWHSILELARCLERLRPQQLRRLKVRGDGVDDAGARALARASASCKQLSVLEIESGNIGDSGAEGLAAAVVECKHLTRFKLSKAYMIGDAGIAALAAASLAVPSVEFIMGKHISSLAGKLHHKWGKMFTSDDQQ